VTDFLRSAIKQYDKELSVSSDYGYGLMLHEGG